MPYSTRNALYLRISSWTVLPLYLYLDERHVPWMTDATLHAALADLRPMLLKKFHDEDPRLGKKSSVEVHRGATYQFAFFFRKTDTRHVVLLKKREYVPRVVPRTIKRQPEPTPEPVKRRRRGGGRTPAATRPEGSPPLLPMDDAPIAAEVLSTPTSAPPTSEQPLFLPSEDEPLVTVKSEPIDDAPDPSIPLRSAEEIHELRAGAEASLGRTLLDTGYEDSVPDGGRGERKASEELLTFRAVEEDEDEKGKDVKQDVKPLMRLSYKGFSIASRHLVLIIEPYPALPASILNTRRARSTYSRSMSRATGVGVEHEREMTTRGETPLVPNSRRGGTGSVRPTPTPTPFAGMRETLMPNSRSGGGRLPSRTPLFRDMTPMSAFGDGASSGGARGPALFDEQDSSDEEDMAWRRRVRQGSYAPWRGASVLPNGEDSERGAAVSLGRRRITESDDSDDIDDDEGVEGDPASDDSDAEVVQARRLMALSQRLQGNTEGRAGTVGAAAVGVDAGELGRGGDDDAYGEGDDGFGDDVGGAEA